MYSVTRGSEGFVVDIMEKTCTCNAWSLSGIPCHHALAVMGGGENMDPTQFIHKCYNAEEDVCIYFEACKWTKPMVFV